MQKLLIFSVIGIVGVTAGLYMATQGRLFSTSSIEPSTTPTAAPITPQPATSASELQRSGKQYQDPEGAFTVWYPAHYILDDADPLHLRIYTRAETARAQSEISDGALLVFESVDLGGKTIAQYVEERIAADTTAEVVEPPKPITINNYSGLEYALRSLGTATTVVLQASPQSAQAVVITYAVTDPQQRNYQAEVDAILGGLQLP